MCGRLCCYCNHSSYSKRLEPVFRPGNQPSWTDSSKFEPSTNLAPASNIPVLYLDEHKNLSIRPMKWGIEIIDMWEIPSERKIIVDSGANPPKVTAAVPPFSSAYLKTSRGKSPVLHNIRVETLLAPQHRNRHFDSLLQSRKCCAIVCDGFYEWNEKRPFFVYNTKNKYDTSVIQSNWREDDWTEKGPPVMLLAGVYSSTVHEGDGLGRTWTEIYTCSVLTKNASPRLKHIHHRSPIMLETQEDIMAWLDRGDRTVEQSLQNLKGVKNDHLSYYEVKEQVNNSRYQGPDCHLPLSCFPTRGTLHKWLSKSQESGSSDHRTDDEEQKCKRKCTSDAPPPRKKTLITDWFRKTPPNQ